MRKLALNLIASVLCIASVSLNAQDKIYINQSNSISVGTKVGNIEEITLSSDNTSLNVTTKNLNTTPFTIADILDITFDNSEDVIQIIYNEKDARIINPLAFDGVTVTKNGTDVTITSTTEEPIACIISGTTTDGSLKLYNSGKVNLSLSNAVITNADGAAINIQGKKEVTITLMDGTENILCDGETYTTVDDEDMKGTLFSEGNLVFDGSGTLDVTALNKHAIVSDKAITVNSGIFVIKSAASDAFHTKNEFTVNGGYFEIAASSDAVDADAAAIEINDGTFVINVTADTSKGIKTDGPITINGGDITINTSGNVVVTEGDPSYCSAVKTDSCVTITGGKLTIFSTGEAGKGITADGDVTITGGTIDIKTTGGGAKYTDVDGVLDSYSATCIKCDKVLSILGGTIIAESTGSAGKGISCDGDIIIGGENCNPSITVKTSGQKFLVSGTGENADYANPKAIKADGNMTIHSGEINVTTTTDGGEGLESKNVMTINGGTIVLNTYDDAINAKYDLTINGGKIFANASGNDGIDSNGTITINGGIVIAVGTNQPEGSFDCDQNTFKITGGVIIGIGGDTSTPTSSVCTQRTIIYSPSNATAGQIIRIEESGNEVVTFKYPRTFSRGKFVFSSNALDSSKTYSILTGGTVSGGENFNGHITGGTHSGGTQATTFTPSSMVTQIGSSGGGPGGGGTPPARP